MEKRQEVKKCAAHAAQTKNKVKIKVKYLDKGIDKLEYVGGSDKSNWIDLRAAKNCMIKAGEFALIPLGVAMKLPEGYEAHIVPRSSTFKKYNIIQTNHMGVIDGSYCGDDDQWYFPAYAVKDTFVEKNTRICQFRIVKNQPVIEFETVNRLEAPNRGGFGSTGK